jgi:hypothetical protein
MVNGTAMGAGAVIHFILAGFFGTIGDKITNRFAPFTKQME